MTRRIFGEKASETGSPILFAEDHKEVLASERAASDVRLYHTASWGDFSGVLSGSYQTKNTNTILVSLNVLAQKFRFTREHVQRGFQDVNRLTGLRGRWEVVCDSPKTVCDAGHNVGGWNYLARELEKMNINRFMLSLAWSETRILNPYCLYCRKLVCIILRRHL